MLFKAKSVIALLDLCMAHIGTKMKTKALFTAFTLFWAMTALAQEHRPAEWVSLTEIQSASVYVMVGSGTWKAVGNYVRVWIMYDMKPPFDSETRSIRSYEELDCKDARVRVLQAASFGGQMAKGKLISTSNIPGEWSFAVPGTIPDYTLKLVCPK